MIAPLLIAPAPVPPVEVWIPCVPVGRPRVDHRAVKTRTGWRAVAYIPENPKAFKRGPGGKIVPDPKGRMWIASHDFRRAIRAAVLPLLPSAPWPGPVRVDLEIFLPRPQYMTGRKYPKGRIPHTAKPDRDNLEKAILDALTRRPPAPPDQQRGRVDDAGFPGLWEDDDQVCAGEPRKWYAPLGSATGVYLRAQPFDAEQADRNAEAAAAARDAINLDAFAT